MRGLITFEGIDGCGKTTQLAHTEAWLRARGITLCTTREPGATPLGATLRTLLLEGSKAPVPEAELLLFLADRAQHVRQIIQPALARGALVLCDRYSDSTRAYQMAARRLGGDAMDALLAFAECGVRPALTLWFDVPLELAIERMRKRERAGQHGTRLDREQRAFHRAVADAFARLHAQEPERIRRIHAVGDVAQVQQQVRAVLGAWLEGKR
ncbi:MAG: dTMP kinase [Zetaproteobacteria bacterium]|nr:MAG: dTMP kinase [Zetaproteobacteria bacterium]